VAADWSLGSGGLLGHGLEAHSVSFSGDTRDCGVCHVAIFRDPDGTALILHHG
jgi:hypothetical protein